MDESTLMRYYETELEIASTSASDSKMSFWLTPVTRTEPTTPLPRIRVALSQIAAIRAAPSSVLLSFSDKEKISRHVVLIAGDETEWEITAVEADAPWLTIQADAQDPAARNRKITISATKPESGKAKLQQSDVRIHTSHPHCREIVVRVTAVQG